MAEKALVKWAPHKITTAQIRQVEDGETNFLNKKRLSLKYRQLLAQRRTLPMYRNLDQFVPTFQRLDKVLVAAGTGSGKSTQIPQAVLASFGPACKKLVAVIQPRRLAVTEVTKRVAAEMDVDVGQEVGWSMRASNNWQPGVTRLQFMTDGKLLARARSDRTLREYCCVIVDEAHERALHTDILMGLLKKIHLDGLRPSPNDLKVVVMSATLDSSTFSAYLPDSQLVTVEGNNFPVGVSYLPDDCKDEPIQKAAETVLDIHLHKHAGDILIFAASRDDIRQLSQAIDAALEKVVDQVALGELRIEELTGGMDTEDQRNALKRAPLSTGKSFSRKVIIATNIAETSVTVPGIVFVIDLGYSNQKFYDPRADATFLIKTFISKASALQRTGRTGRTGPGWCFRMYSEQTYLSVFPDHTPPAILTSDAAPPMMTMLSLSSDPAHPISPIVFPLMQSPAPDSMMRSWRELIELGFYDRLKGVLTREGVQAYTLMTSLPLARALFTAVDLGCSGHIADLIAMMEAMESPGGYLWLTTKQKDELNEIRRDYQHQQSQHLQLINIYADWRAFCNDNPSRGEQDRWCANLFLNARLLRHADVRRRALVKIMRQLKLTISYLDYDDPAYFTKIRRAICAGLFMNAAYWTPHPQQTGKSRYTNMRGDIAFTQHWFTPADESKVLENKEWIVYSDYRPLERSFKLATVVHPEWLIGCSSRFFDLEGIYPSPLKSSLLRAMVNVTGKDPRDLLGMWSTDQTARR